MAKHVTYIPDCEKCGAEMVKLMKYRKDEGSDNAFGTKVHWWRCPACGFETDHVDDPEEFERITAELVSKL